MSNFIHPIILLSISEKASIISEFIENKLGRINNAQLKGRYFRHIRLCENTIIRTTLDDEIIDISLTGDDKFENYKIVNSNGDYLKALFEKILNSIYNLDNINHAVELDLQLGSPQIIVLAEVDVPILSPFIIPLLHEIKFQNTPQVHLVLLYNTKLQSDSNTLKNALYKSAFFREIESQQFALAPYIWLLDIVNERGINLDDEKILYYSITQFIDLLFTNATHLVKSVYNSNFEKGKPCMYSTFGFSRLIFPEKKIKEYLIKYAMAKEFYFLANNLNSKFEAIALKGEITKFFQANNFDQIPERIAKNSKGNSIFIPFNFNFSHFIDNEKQQVSEKIKFG